jgi:hypothetical protein
MVFRFAQDGQLRRPAAAELRAEETDQLEPVAFHQVRIPSISSVAIMMGRAARRLRLGGLRSAKQQREEREEKKPAPMNMLCQEEPEPDMFCQEEPEPVEALPDRLLHSPFWLHFS